MFTLTDMLVQWGPHHGPHYGAMGPTGGAGGGYLWGPVWLLLAVLIIVAGGYLLLRAGRDQETTTEAGDALAILSHRYAHGEIDDEEFEKRREKLTRSQGS